MQEGRRGVVRITVQGDRGEQKNLRIFEKLLELGSEHEKKRKKVESGNGGKGGKRR